VVVVLLLAWKDGRSKLPPILSGTRSKVNLGTRTKLKHGTRTKDNPYGTLILRLLLGTRRLDGTKRNLGLGLYLPLSYRRTRNIRMENFRSLDPNGDKLIRNSGTNNKPSSFYIFPLINRLTTAFIPFYTKNM